MDGRLSTEQVHAGSSPAQGTIFNSISPCSAT